MHKPRRAVVIIKGASEVVFCLEKNDEAVLKQASVREKLLYCLFWWCRLHEVDVCVFVVCDLVLSRSDC